MRNEAVFETISALFDIVSYYSDLPPVGLRRWVLRSKFTRKHVIIRVQFHTYILTFFVFAVGESIPNFKFNQVLMKWGMGNQIKTWATLLDSWIPITIYFTGFPFRSTE